jgi:hypothetical protein
MSGPGRSACSRWPTSKASHKLREIEQFFHTYKNLEDKSVEIDGWAGVAETLEILRFDRQRWLDEQPDSEAAGEV